MNAVSQRFACFAGGATWSNASGMLRSRRLPFPRTRQFFREMRLYFWVARFALPDGFLLRGQTSRGVHVGRLRLEPQHKRSGTRAAILPHSGVVWQLINILLLMLYIRTGINLKSTIMVIVINIGNFVMKKLLVN